MALFDDFTPPPQPQQGGLFSDFKPPASSSSAAPSQSWGDYLLGHLAGAANTLNSATRVAQDAATFGLMDKAFGKQAQADTAQAYKDVGPWSLPISLAGSMVTAGPQLKAASAVADAAAPYVGKWLGGVVGSGAVGAAGGAAGAYGHDEDVGQGAKLGGLLGAAGGTLGGVAGRGGELAPAISADDLKAQASQAYAPLSNILYDATKEVHPALDTTTAQNAMRDWSGLKWNDAAKTRAEINTLLARPQLSANDLQQSQSYLGSIAKSGDPNERLYAGYYRGQLQDVLENALPQTGVPPGAQPVGYAAGVKAAGDELYGRAQDVARLDDWIQQAKIPNQPDTGTLAGRYLASDAGQRFAAPGSPAYDALTTLADTAKPPVTPGLSAWDIRHFMHPIVGAGIGGALGATHSSDPTTIAEEALGGALTGVVLHKGVPMVQGALGRAAQQRAIDAARSTLSTGQFQAPLAAAAPTRDALRSLIYGLGARGAY